MSLANNIWNLSQGDKVQESFTGTIIERINLRAPDKTKVKATPAEGGPPLEILINGLGLGDDIVNKQIVTNGGMVSEYKGQKGLMVFPKEVTLDGTQLQEPRREGGGPPSASTGGSVPAGSSAAPPQQREQLAEVDVLNFIDRATTKFPWLKTADGNSTLNGMLVMIGRREMKLNPGIDTGNGGIDTGDDQDEVPV